MYYNFKKEVKVYAYSAGTLYRLDVYSDISLSQTFKESDYERKTLHTPLDLYRGGVIEQANPANFSVTIPLRSTTESSFLYSLMAPDYTSGNIPSFDLYVELSSTIYKLETAVVENVVYNLEKDKVLTISISGTGAKLTQGNTLPATPVSLNTNYLSIAGVEATVDDQILSSIAAVHLEIDNSITWLPCTTVHAAVAGEVVYPTQYVLTERRVSGSITQFLTDDNINSGYDYGTYPISVDIYTDLNIGGPILTFDLPETIFTRRVSMEDLVTRVYDFRLTSNEVFVYPEI